ncbi:MAG TPA: RNA polymerase sigma factor [Thermoanaerobaculia bacterium]|nr:RNA polymerase sigma factor [Thermoanaerobaculia bacterium]
MQQDELYATVLSTFGAALERLARSYEADDDKRRDLLQEIHFALWRSLSTYAERCSLRTWVYRVAQNVAASHVVKGRRARPEFVGLDDVGDLPTSGDETGRLDRQITLDRIYGLIRTLTTLDRDVILLYLEGFDAASIAEITGLAATNVHTKIHRIKKLLKQLTKGESHGA